MLVRNISLLNYACSKTILLLVQDTFKNRGHGSVVGHLSCIFEVWVWSLAPLIKAPNEDFHTG